MPFYKQVKDQLPDTRCVTTLKISSMNVEILESRLPGTTIPLLFVNCPALFDRDGNPYTDEKGITWADNAERFALFCRAIVMTAVDQVQLNWKPDILHCNDWHTGLACPLLTFEEDRPKTVFTIHNLAYQGLFSYETFKDLQLPDELWSYNRVEYNGQLSFIKAGIVYADYVNTVSPTYAEEIKTAEYGAGLEALLQYHSSKLSGIINGIDIQEWNPGTDKNIYSNYTIQNLDNKSANKTSLQKELDLTANNDTPLFTVISRIAEQKGIDLIINILPELIKLNVQIAILGSGDSTLEKLLLTAAARYKHQLAVKIGYDEVLAHKITAAADFFLMPSRYEPCGLNQMYSQQYGTIPIVRSTGGLEDTVIDNNSITTDNCNSTGLKFTSESSAELLNTIVRAIDIYNDKSIFNIIRLNAMKQDFSWTNSANQYIDLYTTACAKS
jgi:starch synthase